MKNIAKCAKCDDIIESKFRHDFVRCKCGAIAVDGGNDYIKRSGNPEDFDREFDYENGLIPTEKPAPTVQAFDGVKFETVDMNTLVTQVWNWFEIKGLSDPVMQMVKCQEELGELAHEISRGHRQSPEVEDALGDVLVTVIGMCHHLHYHPAKALATAYNEIKNRKGKVVEGSFIKDER